MTASDPHSFSDPSQGRIAHLRLKLSADFSERVLTSQASYLFAEPVSGSLHLDTRDLEILGVHADGGEIEWELGPSDPVLGEQLTLSGLDSVSELTIDSRTSRKASALQWLEPGQTAGGKLPYLYSQCQAVHARSIFPCQDSPSVRFTYETEIKVPQPLTPIMGAEHVRTEDDAGKRIAIFRMPQPIPAYLFAIAIGNIEYQELGPRTGVFAEPEVIEAAAWEFAENEAKLTEAEKLFGPYLWDRYDILVLPPAFPFGGMENPRLTFLNPVYLLGDRSDTAIISHELAHSWTGNLATNSSWEHFWINEGWTTYAERRITEALYGSDYSELRTAVQNEELVKLIARLGVDSGLTSLKTSIEGKDPDESVSIVPYVKGYLFIHQLEQAVGREKFDEFVKGYIQTYAFRSLSSEDFIRYLKQELPEVSSEVDLEQWIYDPELPKGVTEVHSRLRDEVQAVLAEYSEGVLPTEDQVSDWNSQQTLLFLYSLPESIPLEDCKYFDKLFDFNNSRHAGLLAVYYGLAILSGNEELFPRVEEFVGSIGRAYLLAKVYRAMVQAEWSRPLARPTYERAASLYHPITVSSIEAILKDAGL